MKRKLYICLTMVTLFIVTQNVQSQDKPKIKEVESKIDEPSNPVKGMEHLYTFIGKEMKYPKQASEAGVEGRVYIEFIINKSGSIENAKVIKGIGAGCDKEALRAFQLYPGKWTLPKHNGKLVNQQIVLPVSFKLGKSTESKDKKS